MQTALRLSDPICASLGLNEMNRLNGANLVKSGISVSKSIGETGGPQALGLSKLAK